MESLISEGVEETFGNSPWHVAVYDIRDKEDMKLICGGTIITQRIIVSGKSLIETHFTVLFESTNAV